MRQNTLFLIVSIILVQSLNAGPIFDNPRLDTFVTDLLDKNTIRHYDLVSKQGAIHKMLIRECMHDLGFADESSTDPADWSQALHGKYAYCQDHHIQGIDPPCPSEDIVEMSVNGSCWQLSYNQIDWSHNIMHVARKDFPDEWENDPSNSALLDIEAEWVACMETEGFRYQSRFDMFESFGAAVDLSPEVQATLPDQEEVRRSAKNCFEITEYYKKRSELFKARRNQSIALQHDELLILLERYEAAEYHADTMIQKYCESKRDVIINMYEQDKYSEKAICELQD